MGGGCAPPRDLRGSLLPPSLHQPSVQPSCPPPLAGSHPADCQAPSPLPTPHPTLMGPSSGCGAKAPRAQPCSCGAPWLCKAQAHPCLGENLEGCQPRCQPGPGNQAEKPGGAGGATFSPAHLGEVPAAQWVPRASSWRSRGARHLRGTCPQAGPSSPKPPTRGQTDAQMVGNPHTGSERGSRWWRTWMEVSPPLPAPTFPMLSEEGSGTMLGWGWGQEESLWPGQAQSHMGAGLSPGVPLPHWTAYSSDRAPARGPNT